VSRHGTILPQDRDQASLGHARAAANSVNARAAAER
jgi:hypothetical protein